MNKAMKQYVLTDGKQFLALDYKYEDYYITDDIYSAYSSHWGDMIDTRKYMHDEMKKSVRGFKLVQIELKLVNKGDNRE